MLSLRVLSLCGGTRVAVVLVVASLLVQGVLGEGECIQGLDVSVIYIAIDRVVIRPLVLLQC